MKPIIIRYTAISLMVIVIAGFGYQVYLSSQNPITYLRQLGEAPDFTLPNTDGNNFTLSETDGKIRILTFIYTKCDQGCSMLNTKMADIRDRLIEENMYQQTQLITIDFDYKYDNMTDLRTFGNYFRIPGDTWQFLLGDQNQTKNVTEAYNFQYYEEHQEMNSSTDDHTSDGNEHAGHSIVYTHPFMTWFIDQHREIRSIQLGLEWTSETGANMVEFLINENNS